MVRTVYHHDDQTYIINETCDGSVMLTICSNGRKKEMYFKTVESAKTVISILCGGMPRHGAAVNKEGKTDVKVI